MAIAFRAGGAFGGSAANSLSAGPFNCVLGDLILVGYCIRTTTSTGNAPTDTIGNRYYLLAVLNNGTNIRCEVWYTFSKATNASNNPQANLSATSKMTVVAASYSGVGGIGTVTSATQSTANPTQSLQTIQANDWIASVFAGQGISTFSASVGNLRVSATSTGASSSSNAGGALVDGTSASANTTVTNTASNTDTIWANISVVLEVLAASYDDPYTVAHDVNLPMQSQGKFQMLDQTELENWGFKPPVVVPAISPFDEQDAQRHSLISIQPEIEDEQFSWGYKPPTIPTYQEDIYGQNPPLQLSFFVTELDVDFDMAQSTFFALEQYGEVQEYGPAQQQSLVPTVDSDFDMAQSTFFALEQYGEVQEYGPAQQQLGIVPEIEDEMFNWGYATPLAGQGANLMGFRGFRMLKAAMQAEDISFQPPEAGTGQNLMGFRGFWSLRAGMGSVEDNVNFNPPVIVAITAFDEDELPPSIAVITEDAESDQFGFNPPVVVVNLPWDGDVNPAAWLGVVVDMEEQFGLDLALATDVEQQPLSAQVVTQITDEDTSQSPFFALEQFGEVQEYGPPKLQSYYVPELGADLDTSQSTFFALEQYGDVDEQFAQFKFWWDVDEQFSFDSPYAADYDTTLQPAAPVVQSVDDDTSQSTFFALEQFGEVQEYGPAQLISIITADNETEQFGFNQPVVTPITAFDFDVQPLPLRIVVADDDIFGQQPVFVQEDIQGQWAVLCVVEQVEDEQVYPAAPFITPIGFDDSPEHLPLPWWARDDAESTQVYPASPFLTPFPSDDGPEQFASAWIMRLHEEDFGFNVPEVLSELLLEQETELPNSPYPVTYQLDDMFAYGTVPGILPNIFYDADFNPTVQQSYYFNSLEDEMFNWGFKPPAISTYQEDGVYQDRWQQSFTFQQAETEQFDWGFDPTRYYGLGDEAPYFTPLQAQQIWDDVDQFSMDQAFVQDEPQNPVSTFLAVQDDDVWGFNTVVVTAITPFDFDYVLPASLLPVQDDDTWSFNPVVVVTAITPFDELQNPLAALPVMQEDEGFAFDTPAAFGQEDNPMQAQSFDVDEQFGQEPVFAMEQELTPLQARPVVDDVEMYGSNPTFVSDVWEAAGMPPSPPFLYQDDVDVFGRQVPVAYPGLGQDDDQVPQYPAWSMDWAEGCEALPAVVPFHFGVPIVYRVSTEPRLMLQARTHLRLQIYDIESRLRIVSGTSTSGYGLGGYGVGPYGGTATSGAGLSLQTFPLITVSNVVSSNRILCAGIAIH